MPFVPSAFIPNISSRSSISRSSISSRSTNSSSSSTSNNISSFFRRTTCRPSYCHQVVSPAPAGPRSSTLTVAICAVSLRAAGSQGRTCATGRQVEMFRSTTHGKHDARETPQPQTCLIASLLLLPCLPASLLLCLPRRHCLCFPGLAGYAHTFIYFCFVRKTIIPAILHEFCKHY